MVNYIYVYKLYYNIIILPIINIVKIKSKKCVDTKRYKVPE